VCRKQVCSATGHARAAQSTADGQKSSYPVPVHRRPVRYVAKASRSSIRPRWNTTSGVPAAAALATGRRWVKGRHRQAAAGGVPSVALAPSGPGEMKRVMAVQNSRRVVRQAEGNGMALVGENGMVGRLRRIVYEQGLHPQYGRSGIERENGEEGARCSANGVGTSVPGT